jgi:hypothetical protein
MFRRESSEQLRLLGIRIVTLREARASVLHSLSLLRSNSGLLKSVTELAFRFMSLRQLFLPLAFPLGVLSIAATTSDTPADTALIQTMSTMHDAMHEVQLAGKPDIDFARLMIPHHQGAIDMAKVELLFGTDARLRRLAQEIIVTQESEIEVMQKILRESNE